MSADFSYCPELESLYRTRRATGRSGKQFTGLDALSTPNNLVTLRHFMMAQKPERTLEVGLSYGGSALVFTSAHHDLGHAAAAQHMSLDPFQESVWDDTGILAVERAGLGGYLDFRPARSSIEMPRLLALDASFGLIYIDGSHLVEDVFVDAYYAVRLLAAGGIVVFDDSANPHVAKVIRFLRTNLRGGLDEIDLIAQREDRRDLRYRLARALGRVQLTAFRRVGDIERDWTARYNSF